MRWPLLLLALVSGCAEPQREPIQSGGIVSTNPCADAMLVDLAPDRIRAISRYSQDPTASSLPLDVARRFSTTAGTAEEVIALHPALVVTSSFTPIATQAAYRRAGLPVLTLDSPRSVAASEAQIRTLAEAVGEPQRGRAMVARIDAALAAVPRRTPAIDALLFLGGSLANGPGNLLDELMRRVGFANAAQHYGLTYSTSVTMETIVAAPPALLLEPGPTRGGMLRGKVLARMGAATRLATIPRALLNCGGPSIVPVITRLVAIRRTFG